MKLVSAPPKSWQIADYIIQQIKSGRIVPGERLSSIRKLADSFGVGRQVVHSAFELLSERGVLTSEIGRGTFVSPDCRIVSGRRRIGFYIHKGGISTQFNNYFFNSCCRCGNSMGHDILLGSSMYEIDLKHWVGNLDGMLVTGSVDEALIAELESHGKPFVVCGNYDLNCRMDILRISSKPNTIRLLSSACSRFGIRSLGVVAGHSRYYSTRRLLNTIREFAETRNLVCRDEFLICDDDETGYDGMQRMMSLPERPDMVYLTLDTYLGAVRYLYEHNLVESDRHPRLINVSYSYEQMIFRSLPDITGVYSFDEEYTREALSLLLRKIEEPGGEKVDRGIKLSMQMIFNR